MVTISAPFKFDKKEIEVLNIIKQVAQENNTVARIAGGYIRDKILCVETSDIDIAVSNMSGEEFATKLVAWMKSKNIHTRGMAVVKANPDQSKHLATAMVDVLGFGIDFANLRKETYANSRIPTIEPGTPEEDAGRRDLTINSLFYNIHTEKVEDYVGGLEHLKLGYAVTPIDAFKTFQDDPLRILRIVRFASKYGLTISQDIYDAALQPSIHSALFEKVSKERIWKEMAGQDDGHGGWKPGFFSGPSPENAFVMLRRMNLHDMFFFDNCPAPLWYINKDQDQFGPKEKLIRTLAILYWNAPKYFNRFCIKYGVPNEISKRVQKILENSLIETPYNKNLRMMLVTLGEDWKIAYQISCAIMPKSSSFYSRIESQIELMKGLKVSLPINGNDVMEIGVGKGKAVGTVLTELTDAWYEDPTLSREEAFSIVRDMIEKDSTLQR